MHMHKQGETRGLAVIHPRLGTQTHADANMTPSDVMIGGRRQYLMRSPARETDIPFLHLALNGYSLPPPERTSSAHPNFLCGH